MKNRFASFLRDCISGVVCRDGIVLVGNKKVKAPRAIIETSRKPKVELSEKTMKALLAFKGANHNLLWSICAC